jgi:hypothetical protein
MNFMQDEMVLALEQAEMPARASQNYQQRYT